MAFNGPQARVRVAVAVSLLAAALAVGGVALFRQSDPGTTSPRDARRASTRPTPASIPHASGIASTEGGVQPPGDQPPPVSLVRKPAFTVPFDGSPEVRDRFGSPRGPELVHGGIDLGLPGPDPAPVYSPCLGTVAFTGYNDSYGAHVVVDCGDSWTTVLGFLGEIDCSSGTAASSVTVVGESEPSGGFVHVEIRWRDIPLDPEAYLDLSRPPSRPFPTVPAATPDRESRRTPIPANTVAPAPPTSQPGATDTPTPRPTPTPTPGTPKPRR